MSDWNDFISNDATPHNRRLLLITQPDTFDAAQEHIYDVVVGYWNELTGAFVQAVAPSDKATGRTLRVHKWRDLPELPKLTLRDLSRSKLVSSRRCRRLAPRAALQSRMPALTRRRSTDARERILPGEA
jgi:hypothetical protein